MKVIRADQEATGDMFDAASRITRLASLWSAMRDAAPTLDAVPVEELREFRNRLGQDRGLAAAMGGEEFGGVLDRIISRANTLIAKHEK